MEKSIFSQTGIAFLDQAFNRLRYLGERNSFKKNQNEDFLTNVTLPKMKALCLNENTRKNREAFIEAVRVEVDFLRASKINSTLGK